MEGGGRCSVSVWQAVFVWARAWQSLGWLTSRRVSSQGGKWWRRGLSQEERTESWCQGERELWRCVGGQTGGLRGCWENPSRKWMWKLVRWRGHRPTIPFPTCLGPEAIQLSESFRFQIGYILHVPCKIAIVVGAGACNQTPQYLCRKIYDYFH